MGKRNRHSKPKQQIAFNPPMDLAVGDCIAVRPGVKDPDYGRDIGGWQGRVTEIERNSLPPISSPHRYDTMITMEAVSKQSVADEDQFVAELHKLGIT